MAAPLGNRPIANSEVSQGYIWDVGTLSWIPATAGGGGGGGGAVTIADGADVAQGLTTDVAVVSDINGTVSGKLRGLVKILANVWDSGNSRLNVAIANTPSISGTVSVSNFPATQPVSGSVSVSNFPASQPVTGTFWQATQPISATTLPLPTGAALDATLTGGTAQTKITDGTRIANVKAASTAAIATDPALVVAVSPNNSVAVTGTVTTTPPANASTNVAQVAGTTTDTNSGLKSAGTLRVVLATDQPALTAKLLVTPDSVALPANQSVNVAQLAGTATTVNKGASDAGTLRVSLGDGTQVVGALTANQSVNVAQVAGAALTTSATGVQKVGVVGNAGAIFDGATAAAVPANVIYNGARAATANPTSASGGNLVGLMADKAGRLVMTTGHARDVVKSQATTISATTTETTIVTAGGAGVFNDITQLIITNSGTAVATWALRDVSAGSVIATFDTPATVGANPLIIPFNPPIPQTTAASAWTLKASTSTSTGVHVWVQFIQNL